MKLRDSANIFVSSLTAPKTIELVESELSKKKKKPGSTWCLDNSLSPADLYTYLKARFGPPNGTMMIVRSPSTDNFIQWHYTLKSGKEFIDIMGMNTRTEIWISGYKGLSLEDWHSLVKAIKDDFKKYGSKMKEVRKSLEKWKLFYSPYNRLERVINKYSQELNDLNIDALELPSDPKVKPLLHPDKKNAFSDIHDYLRLMTEYREKYSRAQELSICLRLLSPVWGEAFVNFIIFMLARSEIKNDNRLYQDYLRSDIDVRIKLLHIKCDHFMKPIDNSSKAFKAFHTLMNERNNLLHGNVDLNKLAYETIYFDDTIPLFTEPQSLGKVALENSLKGIEASKSIECVDLVRSFIKHVLECISPETRKFVKLLLEKRDLGWREETKRIGDLFDDTIVEGYAR